MHLVKILGKVLPVIIQLNIKIDHIEQLLNFLFDILVRRLIPDVVQSFLLPLTGSLLFAQGA
jgi:hypothetical protein